VTTNGNTSNHATFADALAAATDGATITLLQDINESVTIDYSKFTTGLTINLNGHTLTGVDFQSGVPTCYEWSLGETSYTFAKKHTLTQTPGVPASCTTTGNNAYYTCSECGKYFSDAEGKTEIDENSWVIPITHTYVNEICTGCGVHGPNYDRISLMTLEDVTASITDNGNYPWVPIDDKLKSSNKSVGGSISETSITFSSESVFSVSFDYGVSSEARYDKFTILSGDDANTQIDEIHGYGVDDKHFQQVFRPGAYTFTFRYKKDSYGNSGDDSAWVYNINANKVTPCAEGEHNFSLEDVLESTLATPANCIDPATYYYTCSKCYECESNAEHTFFNASHLDHSFINGICEYCQAVEGECSEYLYFTALENGATVKLQKVGEPTATNFQTSTDGNNWSAYTCGTDITLSSIGDKVFFRSHDAITNFSTSGEAYYQFVTGEKKVDVSGRLASLMHPFCANQALTDYAFYRLFKDCTIESLPALPATQLGDYCYAEMFSGCSFIVLNTTAPGYPWKLPSQVTSKSHSFDGMLTNTSGNFTGTPVAGTTYYQKVGIFNVFETDISVSQSNNDSYEWVYSSQTGRTPGLMSSNQKKYGSTSESTITLSSESDFSLSFDYAVSSEKDYDKYTIKLDDEIIADNISGTITDKFSRILSAGTHYIYLKYQKDSSGDYYDDHAYIYNIKAKEVAVISPNTNHYATYSAAKDWIVVTEGVKVYKASLDGTSLVLTELTGYIPAGTGVLLSGEVTSMAIAAKGENDTQADMEGNALLATTLADGSLAAKPTSGYTYALGANNLFLHYTGSEFIHNRAYLWFENDPCPSNAKAMTIVFANGDTTDINNIKANPNDDNCKRIENGRIIIIKNGIKYTTIGQVVK